MKKQILLILSLILGVTTLTFAQATRTITNTDLEKFRQQREQSEAEYRATYQQRGLPSPEELAQREAAREKDLAEYAARARAAHQRDNELQMQRDFINAQIDYQRSQNYSYNQPVFVGGQVSTPYGYGGGFYGNYGGGFYNDYGHRGYRQFLPLPPNVQIVRNAASSFPTANDIRNQIYGLPPQQQIRGGGFGRRH